VTLEAANDMLEVRAASIAEARKHVVAAASRSLCPAPQSEP
jgi:hypothetical protein